MRAAHQRSYFAPALFSLVPVETDLIGSMAVDSHWRLYYNRAWLASHTVEENASLLIHEVSHLLRDHEARRTAAGIGDHRRWNTATDCEINDDLHGEGLPLPGDPPMPGKYGLPSGSNAELYYAQLSSRSGPARARQAAGGEQESPDCGSGAHGEQRFWELPVDDGAEGGNRCRGSNQGGARAARGGEADRRQVPIRRRRSSRVAPLGPGDARAEGRLHGDDPPCRAARRFAGARSVVTIGHTRGLIAGRPATASSSCPASISRGRRQAS